jgi:hypothetical protein
MGKGTAVGFLGERQAPGFLGNRGLAANPLSFFFVVVNCHNLQQRRLPPPKKSVD